VARLKHRLTHHWAAACDYRVLPLSAVGANSEEVAFKAIWGNVRMRLLHLRNAGRLQSAMTIARIHEIHQPMIHRGVLCSCAGFANQ
jgi:hypothetical protein